MVKLKPVFQKVLMMNKLIAAATIFCVVSFFAEDCQAEGETRPNIILILCDDLGYDDVGFNGSKDIQTPELDQLAKHGAVFSSAYVTHPFCGPSRVGLLTGRYPHFMGAQFNIPRNSTDPKEGVSTKEVLMSKAMQNAGYYTGMIGKWHLGTSPQYHPNVRGFDEFYGFLGGGHRYFPSQYQPIYKKQVAAGNMATVWDYLTPLERNGKEVQETEYLTDAFSREASKFVRDGSKTKKPFFLYLSYNAPHAPLEAKDEDIQKYSHIKNKKRRIYAAMVHAVDRGVGEIVGTLKETGQFENTMIVFLSDNGAELKAGGGSSGPLRGGKGDAWEGGFRVPMLVHWPKMIDANTRYNHPVSALDFYPTFAHLGNAKIADGKELDGVNIWDDFVAGRSARKDELIYVLRHRNGYNDVSARQNQWKAVRVNQKRWELYDVDADISEKKDVSSKHPELLKKLVTHAEKWSSRHKDPIWFDSKTAEKKWNELGMPKYEKTFKMK